MDRTDMNKWLVGELPLWFGLARRKPYKTDKPTLRSPRFQVCRMFYKAVASTNRYAPRYANFFRQRIYFT